MATYERAIDPIRQARPPSRGAQELALGEPRFLDHAFQQLAATQGALAAWRDAFRTLGARAPAAVEGAFAAAVRAECGSVFLAVDRFAIHSLCYRQVGDQLLFAERADDLADGDTEVDPQAIFDYLFHHVIPSPRTIFKGVFRLPPGHCAEFSQGRLSVTPYWTPSFEVDHSKSLPQLKDEFRALLADAVSTQIGDGTVGCFLSGGTDSSTVAGMLGQVTGAAAKTFSIGFDAAGYDEMAYARIAARRFGTEHHEYYVTPKDLVQGIPGVARHYDQPFGNSSALPAYYCAKVAREAGIQKMLAGDGGDELFGGNTRYAMQRIFGWYEAVPKSVRRVMEPMLGASPLRKVPLLRKVPGYIDQAKVPLPDRLQMHNLLMRLGVDQVLSPGFLAQVSLTAPMDQQREVWAATIAGSAIDRMLAFDWRYTLAENDLPKVTGTTRLAGVDVGFPLLDDRLLAFSARLPAHYKLKGLKLRWFFKEALRGFLPDEIIKKRKQGFGLPFGVWATRDKGLRQFAEDSLRSLSGRGIVRPEFIARLMPELLPQHPGYYGEMVWILMMLEQWLQQHVPDYRM